MLRPTLPPESARPNVILYLPPGPLFPHSDSTDKRIDDGGRVSIGKPPPEHDVPLSPQHVLASTTLSTVVTVNYRLGKVDTPEQPRFATTEAPQGAVVSKGQKPPEFYKYPTPIHDTLAGFDWILQNLEPERLCVFGTHIGGSLSLMLALTEPKTVHAVAAREPICDWTELDEYCLIEEEAEEAVAAGGGDDEVTEEAQVQLQQVRGTSRTNTAQRRAAPPDLVRLLEAREEFFHTPERYFDAFASPILFLRSAGKGVPRRFPKYLTGPEYPVPVLKDPELLEEDPDIWDVYYTRLEEIETASFDEYVSDEKPSGRRKTLSRWPPSGLDYDTTPVSPYSSSSSAPSKVQVTLPWVRVFIPSSQRSRPKRTVLARQGKEMVSVMRRACFYGLERGFGESRVQWIAVPEPARPADMSSQTRDTAVEEAGRWFRHVLEKPKKRGQEGNGC